jgi:hypothetical protein
MEKLKAFMVACCGCGRVLNSDGRSGAVMLEGGLLHVSEISINFDEVASFDTKDEADQAATQAGWTIGDELGPNHRCPICAHAWANPERRTEQPRGAYISTAEFLTRLEETQRVVCPICSAGNFH